jgi:heme-degrading monooxygenase HmoA
MILEIAVIEIQAGKEAEFEREIAKAAPVLITADGCRGVEIMRSIEKPTRYRLLVEWDSIDDHFRFRKTAAVIPLRSVLANYANSPPTAEHMASIFSAKA